MKNDVKVNVDHIIIATKAGAHPPKIYGGGADVQKALKMCRKNGYGLKELEANAKAFKATLDATCLTDLSQLRSHNGAFCTAYDLGEPGTKRSSASDEPSIFERTADSVSWVFIYVVFGIVLLSFLIGPFLGGSSNWGSSDDCYTDWDGRSNPTVCE